MSTLASGMSMELSPTLDRNTVLTCARGHRWALSSSSALCLCALTDRHSTCIAAHTAMLNMQQLMSNAHALCYISMQMNSISSSTARVCKSFS